MFLKLFLAVAIFALIKTTSGDYGKGHVTYKGFSGHAGHHHKGYRYGGGHVDYKGFSGHAGHGDEGDMLACMMEVLGMPHDEGLIHQSMVAKKYISGY